jgi:hypothetical protein
LDRAGGSASKADNRFPVRRLMLQKNRRFRVPVFLPSTWAGRKFQSCARRCKKFLRNSDRGSPVRDTSSRWAAEVPAFSCEKAKHSQSLMHRRNSSSEFKVARASSPANETIHRATRSNGKPEACPTLRTRKVKQPWVTLRTSTNAVSGFWNKLSITTSGSLPFTISASMIL